MANRYCDALKIPVPSLEALKDHREANTFALLIVALLEHGGPMTLADVADRFAAAGVQPADRSLRSLKRCRPARAPVYRDEVQYELDVHDEELDLWLFRLGLRGSQIPPLKIVRKKPDPLPGPEVPLSVAEIEEAYRDAYLANWSAQRLALTVLDANGGRMRASDVVAYLNRLTRDHFLRKGSAQWWRAKAIDVAEDGTWTLVPDHPALASARKAVRDRLEVERLWEGRRPDPTMIKVAEKRWEERRATNAASFARLRRVILCAFPPEAPRIVSVADVGTRELVTFTGDDFEALRSRLTEYDFIAAVNLRALLRALDFDPGQRRLAELAPPQKSLTLNRRGRSLPITLDLVAQGSCGISRPFGDRKKLRAYLREGHDSRMRRRLEADLKSLFALYSYGHLHGAYRLRWGFQDEILPLSWVHSDEPKLSDILHRSLEVGCGLQVVAGRAPGWDDPWARSVHCRVLAGESRWDHAIVDEAGYVVDRRDVQAVTLRTPARTHG